MLRRDAAVSPSIATLLLVLLTVLIAAILLLLCMGMINFSLDTYEPVPEIIVIQEIHHENIQGKITWAGRLYLIHKGREEKPVVEMKNGRFSYVIKEYDSIILSDHSAVIYVNGIRQPIFINTLQGNEFIPTHHYGVATLAGTGVRGYEWMAGEWAWIDVKDEMITANNEVTLEIVRKSDNKVISRSTKTAPDRWW
ncbi:hypothetical protein O0S10_00090 [Methanocorpusculum sp. MG]|uniref:Archaeal Type IV pilin N-terminal domain-containing protein n=1 Tax=Methanocorpusculum petauri TaxID=3002863 RepID=A0ABT4IES5_9EURY|nr:hypothetical protein [Methanocorpusculum petauri]MCZ0859623.1 hypothetical protein [Methanocorpusculum petauri]